VADAKREIVAISRSNRTCLLEDYETELHFDQMFDRDGEETMDAQEACTALVEMPDGSWTELDLNDWVNVTIH
jgi:hypothetical protein